MKSEDGYKTVAHAADIELVVKKSVFLGYVMPVESEFEAQAFLAALKEQHAEARHHVYAWRIGKPGQNCVQKFSDDGEPKGTAGLPLYNVIVKQDLTDIAIVVVRYFGGILLGTGGLTHAYADAAVAAVAKGQLIDMARYQVFRFKMPYSLYTTYQKRSALLGVKALSVTYTDEEDVEAAVLAGQRQAWEDLLSDLSGGKLQATYVRDDYSSVTMNA